MLQMSQEKEILRLEDTLSLGDSDREIFLTAEGASSSDGTGLSEDEGERPAGEKVPGQREEERPAGAKAPGSQQEVAPRPGGRKIKVKAGMGRVGGSVAAGRHYKMWRRPAWLVTRVRTLGPQHHSSSKGSRRGPQVTRSFGDNWGTLRPGVPYGRVWAEGHRPEGTLPAGFSRICPSRGRILGGSGGLHCRLS